ncbi:transposase [Streptomyces coeruleorubidus]
MHRVAGRCGRIELRRRMRAYVRGLLGPVARKNSWQLAEYAGHATPDGLQHLLAGACWQADELRDDVQDYVAEQLGAPDGVLIVDDTGFLKKGTASAGVQRQPPETVWRPRKLTATPRVPSHPAVGPMPAGQDAERHRW